MFHYFITLSFSRTRRTKPEHLPVQGVCFLHGGFASGKYICSCCLLACSSPQQPISIVPCAYIHFIPAEFYQMLVVLPRKEDGQNPKSQISCLLPMLTLIPRGYMCTANSLYKASHVDNFSGDQFFSQCVQAVIFACNRET